MDGQKSANKRARVCVICATEFLVRRNTDIRLTCSQPCLRKVRVANSTGRKHSAESNAKRSASMKAARANPEVGARMKAASQASMKKWMADPENAAAFARRSSERMRARHADPEWQKVRDARSSRVMKANWGKHREKFTAMAVERYAAGIGVASDASIEKKNAASKWIMKAAWGAMHAETEYDDVYRDVQSRLRVEIPYDGPQEGSDYMEYLSKLGRAVVNSPECRAIADGFMSKAIPRFAKQWLARRP